MSAVSPSLEPIQAGSTKLPWVAPISTFLLVGVNQTFASFDLNFWALLLLLACGALGAGLQLIPQQAKTWDSAARLVTSDTQANDRENANSGLRQFDRVAGDYFHDRRTVSQKISASNR